MCAGVSFRSPGSLIAEIAGTADDDPWSPEAMAWPLLEAIDHSLDEPWCRPLATHVGHFHTGAEAELRRGRRYEVARRLAGLFASYARQRPQLLIDWLGGDPGDLDEDLRWQPELWRALVSRVAADPPHIRHAKTLARLSEAPSDLPARLSLFGHTRLSRTDSELLAALAIHHELHLWLPHPSDRLWRALAGTRGAIPAARTPATAPWATRCSPPWGGTCASCSAACRRTRRPTNTCPARRARTRCSAGCSPTSPPTPCGRRGAR
ncbi:exodeoxyribonuclease V, gamma subunit [Mycobacterium intracellulare]|nr:exodeoxyribonuclease V, gamma subunit [Mycobacterium intracellulare]